MKVCFTEYSLWFQLIRSSEFVQYTCAPFSVCFLVFVWEAFSHMCSQGQDSWVAV